MNTRYKIVECTKGKYLKWYEVWHHEPILWWRDRWVQDGSKLSGPFEFLTLQEAEHYAQREYSTTLKRVVGESEYNETLHKHK